MWGIEGFFQPLLGFFPRPWRVFTQDLYGEAGERASKLAPFLPHSLSLSLSARSSNIHFFAPRGKGKGESGAKRKKNFPLPAPRCRLFFPLLPNPFSQKKHLPSTCSFWPSFLSLSKVQIALFYTCFNEVEMLLLKLLFFARFPQLSLWFLVRISFFVCCALPKKVKCGNVGRGIESLGVLDSNLFVCLPAIETSATFFLSTCLD